MGKEGWVDGEGYSRQKSGLQGDSQARRSALTSNHRICRGLSGKYCRGVDGRCCR